MVASRWPQRLPFLATGIKRSISAVVRYSRVRTEEFTVVGADRSPVRFPTIFCPRSNTTGELLVLSSLVSIGAVVSLARSEGLSGRSAQSLEPPARAAPRRPCRWHRCQSVRPDRWACVVRIRPRGPLEDRVAQIADRKHCLPHARPFRLGFPRKVPVFPICSPAAL